MLLCSNNAFRCLGIKVLAACLLTARQISLYAENSQAKKVFVLHSSHHDLPRIYFAKKKSPKKIISDFVQTVDFAFAEGLIIKRIQDHIIKCVYQQHKNMKVKLSIFIF
jgi:hypothetical protein